MCEGQAIYPRRISVKKKKNYRAQVDLIRYLRLWVCVRHNLKHDLTLNGVFTYGRYEHDDKSSEHWYAITDSVGERSNNGVNH